MTENDLSKRVSDLEELARTLTEALTKSVEAMEVLQSQLYGTTFALTFIARDLRENYHMNVEFIADKAVEHMRNELTEDEERDQMLKNILVGNTDQIASAAPKLTLIRGGKDDPSPGTSPA